jgi:hypothetical protein
MELPNKTTCPPLSSPDEPVEKRSCPRFPFSCSVQVLDLRADVRIGGRLSDISRNGCYVDTINPFEKDATVILTVTRNNQSFKTQAKVAYTKAGMGMGLLFTTAEPEQLRVLGCWLDELGGQKTDEEEHSNLFLERETGKNTDIELRQIVSELVALLNGKSVLDDSEGMALLRKLAK